MISPKSRQTKNQLPKPTPATPTQKILSLPKSQNLRKVRSPRPLQPKTALTIEY